MVIHRTFKPQAALTRDRRSLGRLQVSIDDLKVLIELLRSRGGATFEGIDDATGDVVDVPYNEPVVVEFDEGTFTDAEDMRQLSDANLRELRVSSGDITVHLSPFRAEALGPTQMNDTVENVWARPRRTKKRPARTEPSGLVILAFFAMVSALLGLVFIVLLGEILMDPVLPGPLASLLIITMVAVTLGLAFGVIRIRHQAHYAVIIPLSLDELRKQERGRNKWQNVSGVVGIISLIVAITVAVVNRLIPMH
ncbi:MAG: hypothetical protein ACRDQ0_04300 [Pseudonocardia sp.]